jgi:hypothetical protein
MTSVIVAMIVLNVRRLNRFLNRDLREYDCIYYDGFPSPNLIRNGKLGLIIYKRRKREGNKDNNGTEDRITFGPPHLDPEKISLLSKEALCVPSKNISEVRIFSNSEGHDEDDKKIQVTYNGSDGNIAMLIFRLKNQIMREVLEGIKEMVGRKKVKYDKKEDDKIDVDNTKDIIVEVLEGIKGLMREEKSLIELLDKKVATVSNMHFMSFKTT